MALVAYDYGSESENDEEEPSSESEAHIAEVSRNTELKNDEISKASTNANTNKISPTNSIFSTLPPTKHKDQIDHEDKIEDFIPKLTKQKQKVRITIPSLSQFNTNDDDEPQIKKAKPSTKNSGLLGILPPVKSIPLSTKSFVPHSVKNKNIQKPNKNSLVPHSVRKKSEVKKKEILGTLQKKQPNAGSDLESDDDLEIPESFDDAMWEKVCGRSKPKPEIVNATVPEEVLESTVNIAPEPETPYDGLDNQAFKQLVGKTKRPMGNIKLIDINEEEILPDRDLWMTKSLTDPDMVPRSSAEDQVDPTKRKKHHITYLAQQAKANEQELQSSWASSRNNRMMSRAKYGF